MDIKSISTENIIKALQEKNVNLPCHRCGSTNFDVVSTTVFPINQNLNSISVGGPSIPAVIIACSNCGVLSTHALAPLGLVNLEAK